MNENVDVTMTELLKNVPTDTLITLLRERDLTVQDVAELQSLRPAEAASSSQAIIATGGSNEIKLSADQFVKEVVRKNAQGKLPARSKINGVQINRSFVGGFYDHGPDQMLLSSLESNVSQLHNIIICERQDELPDLMNAHVVSVTPSEQDRGNMVLTIHFFQDRKQIDSRGWCTPAYISAELPSGVMTEFLGGILKDPDLLEDFYQMLFVGLDSQDNAPGMRRTKADGFYLISGAKLEEAGKVGRYDTRGVSNFFASLEKHHYQQGPYGTGEFFKPR